MASRTRDTRKQVNDVMFLGPAGRLEGRYHVGDTPDSPGAIILHPHPAFGGTMNDRISYELFQMFAGEGFAVLRFNFRGVGRSQGAFDHGMGELADAAAALDWLQSMNPSSQRFWVAGSSFGAWIGMQLLMRRPEVSNFISIAPPSNLYDFSFLAPCPTSGLVVYGTEDKVTPGIETERMVERTRVQKGVEIEVDHVEGANHFFTDHLDPLIETCLEYLRRGLRGDLPVPVKSPGRMS